MKIKALVSFLVAVCFVTVNVLAQAPVEKKADKAKTEKVEKKADKKADKKEAKKDAKKDDCDPKTCKDAKNAKKPCCADKKPAKAEEKK